MNFKTVIVKHDDMKHDIEYEKESYIIFLLKHLGESHFIAISVLPSIHQINNLLRN